MGLISWDCWRVIYAFCSIYYLQALLWQINGCWSLRHFLIGFGAESICGIRSDLLKLLGLERIVCYCVLKLLHGWAELDRDFLLLKGWLLVIWKHHLSYLQSITLFEVRGHWVDFRWRLFRCLWHLFLLIQCKGPRRLIRRKNICKVIALGRWRIQVSKKFVPWMILNLDNTHPLFVLSLNFSSAHIYTIFVYLQRIVVS